MLIYILLAVSLFLVFFGSIFTTAGLDLLRDQKGYGNAGLVAYCVGISGLILACAASFYAGVIS